MTDVLIRNPKEWESLVRAKRAEIVSEKDQFFVEHDMVEEFSLYAIRNSRLEGAIMGIIGTLVFAVILAAVVRLAT